ncbi:MAG: PEP-utilizing enzyme [Candidatus Gastranaerophilaceae bacterium]
MLHHRAAVGKIVFDTEEAAERGNKGEKVILVRIETCPDDIHGMIASQGVLTLRGGMTSHAAVVAKGMGKPCVAGAEDLKIDLKNETLTAAYGKVYKKMISSHLTAVQAKLWKALFN